MPANYWLFLEHFGLLVAFITFWSAVYRGLCSRADLARHHEALAAYLAWLATGPWLVAMQRGVRWILYLLTIVYGAPKAVGSHGFRRFLTIRAWKMSAWFAAFFLFVLPLAGAVLATVLAPIFGGTRSDNGAATAAIGAFCAAIAAFIYSFRAIQGDVSGSSTPQIRSLIRGGVLLFGFVAAFGAVLGIGSLVALPVPDFFTVIAMGILLGGLICSILYAVRTSGFFAPIALTVHIIVAVAFFVPSGFAVAFIGDLISMEFGDTGRKALFLPPILLVFYVCRSVFRTSSSLRLTTAAVVATVIYETMLLAFIENSGTVRAGPHAIALIGAVPMLFILPYVLAMYAAIYSNSIPDWFSIALTRQILTRASEAAGIGRFCLFLALDALAATAFVILTFVILLVIFYVCGRMMLFAVEIGDFDASFRVPADFFLGSTEALPTLVELARTWSLPEPPGQTRLAGAVGILFLAALGATSLLPTLINALVLLVLIGGRLLATIFGPFLRRAHAILLLDSQDHAEGESLSYIRSIATFGFLIALAVSLLILPFLALRLI